jgi:peroxiredoxin Q/BCP
LSHLEKVGVAAVGISPDKPEAQLKFDQKYNLGFPLLSDEDKTVAKAYGAFGPKTVRGQEKEGMIRSSFLIDEKGKLLNAWYKVKPEDTVPKTLDTLERL